MKTTKRILATLLCLLLITVCGFTASAADSAVISLSDETAMPGELVTIDISISNNPGIMAMSFCITYDSDAFEYTGYNKGYLSRYTIKDHPDKGQIAFVNDEASDKSNNGVMLSVKFKIKDNAAPGKHTITIANQNREKYGAKLHNSFSNSDLKYIVPSVTAGSITVGETCENAGHKYGDWTVITPADCVSTGKKEHTCLRCYYTETADIPITHDFETDWTVDKAATPTEDGTMSRHCKNCDAVTDEITFTYKEVEDSQTPDDNTSSEDSVSGEDTSGDVSGDNSSGNVSDEDNSSNSGSSSEQIEQNSTSSDNTSSSVNSNSSDSTSNKTPINNTVGAKNPQSAVENIKDYQENIKPNTDSNTSSDNESTDTESNSVSDGESVVTDADSSKPAGTDDISNTETNLSAGDIALFAISGVISIAIIALAIILILQRKKENKEES